MEAAAGGRIHGARNLADQHVLVFLAYGRIRLRHGLQKEAGVRVFRILIHVLGIANFAYLSKEHDAYPVGQVTHHAEVVRNEQVGQLEFGLQVSKQVEHLCLNRYVKRGNRFIAYDQPGVQRQSTGDAHALPLPTGKLMRVAVDKLRPDAAFFHKFFHALRGLCRSFINLMGFKRFCHDIPDGPARIQRRIRILEDQLHLLAELAHFLLLKLLHDLPIKGDGICSRLDQVQDQSAQGRFAAAGFADKRQRLTLVNVKVHAADRMHYVLAPAPGARTCRELLCEATDLN